MKTYKIWEVQESLNKNPKLKFKTKVKNGNAIAKCYDGCINFVHDGEDHYSLDYYTNELNDLNKEWTLVLKSVDFMIAINSKKKIKPENFLGDYLEIDQLMEVFYGLDEDKVLEYINGNWFIKEE